MLNKCFSLASVFISASCSALRGTAMNELFVQESHKGKQTASYCHSYKNLPIQNTKKTPQQTNHQPHKNNKTKQTQTKHNQKHCPFDCLTSQGQKKRLNFTLPSPFFLERSTSTKNFLKLHPLLIHRFNKIVPIKTVLPLVMLNSFWGLFKPFFCLRKYDKSH